MSELSISNSVARDLILIAQGLHTKEKSSSTKSTDIYNLIKHLGWIQIDTINVIERSHYLTIWSRLGNYQLSEFNKLIYGTVKNRKLFEYWLHCASIIPLDYYRYRLSKMYSFQKGNSTFYGEFQKNKNNKLLDEIRSTINLGESVKSRQFTDVKPKGGWWNWKLSKKALEYLYCTGELMVEKRVDFNKVYNTSDRVLPEWVNKAMPSDEETLMFILEKSAMALGLATLKEIADYSYSKITSVKGLLDSLVRDGILIAAKVEGVDGKIVKMVLHKDNLTLIELINKKKLFAQRTTLLNPFDNLFWAKKSIETIFGFKQVLEAYKPENKRMWGYYTMPILFRNSLIGRVEPKLDRSNNRLIIKKIYFEKGVELTDDMYKELNNTIAELASFHNATPDCSILEGVKSDREFYGRYKEKGLKPTLER